MDKDKGRLRIADVRAWADLRRRTSSGKLCSLENLESLTIGVEGQNQALKNTEQAKQSPEAKGCR